MALKGKASPGPGGVGIAGGVRYDIVGVRGAVIRVLVVFIELRVVVIVLVVFRY